MRHQNKHFHFLFSYVIKTYIFIFCLVTSSKQTFSFFLFPYNHSLFDFQTPCFGALQTGFIITLTIFLLFLFDCLFIFTIVFINIIFIYLFIYFYYCFYYYYYYYYFLFLLTLPFPDKLYNCPFVPSDSFLNQVHNTIQYKKYNTYNTKLNNTKKYNKKQNNTIQYKKIQKNTIKNKTIQYNTQIVL